MQLFPSFSLDQNIMNALGMVFLHSLWQFTIIATLTSWVLKRNVVKPSQARYTLALLSLATMVGIALATFWYYVAPGILSSGNTIPEEVFNVYLDVNSLSTESEPEFSAFHYYQDWILTFWATGVFLLGLKWLGSLLYIEYLKRSALYPGNENFLLQQWGMMRAKWGISKNIRLGLSHHIQSPILVGQIKPVILFPISLVNALNPEEVEFILLHELAHYARCDWWANLLQSIVEIIFYYHPAIYYVSRLIREEREACCDEYAIKTIGGQHVAYAKTLLKLQEWEKGYTPSLAMAFSNKNQIFMDRIKKILNMNQSKNVKSENILIGLIIVSSLFFATRETLAKNIDVSGKTNYLSEFFQLAKPDPVIISDSMPKKEEKIIIIKKNENKDVKVEMKNGEISRLEIDGKEIKPEDYNKYEEVTKDIKIKTFKGDKSDKNDFFFFNMDDEGMQWNGNMDMKWDSMFQNFSMDGLKNYREHLDNFKKEMEKMQEKMKTKEFRYHIEIDTMMNGDHPGKELKLFFEDDDIREGKPKVFEYSIPHIERIEEYGFPGDGRAGGRKNIQDVMGHKLNSDGLLIPNKENKVELTGKYLKINGEKQPSNIWNKYKSIFEEESGAILEKNSKISFRIMGLKVKTRRRTF